MLHVVTVLIEQPNGSIASHSREFGGFKRDCRSLAAWPAELQAELVVMESTGIYWKSLFSHLENAGLTAWVVNAHFIKHVPGRKTDMLDSEWLAVLARFGLVRGLIEGQSQAMLLSHARGALKRKTEDLAASLDGDLSERHLLVLHHLSESIEALQRKLTDIDAYLMRAMQPYAWGHSLLQTIPGIDEIAAALILIEIGDDMARFGSPQRLACWAALSPGNNESAGKRKSGRTRHGNNTIRYILCECANAARMIKSTLASKFKSLMVRKSHKKAIVALAHKMIRLIYILLSRRKPYIDQAIGKWPATRAPAAKAAT